MKLGKPADEELWVRFALVGARVQPGSTPTDAARNAASFANQMMEKVRALRGDDDDEPLSQGPYR